MNDISQEISYTTLFENNVSWQINSLYQCHAFLRAAFLRAMFQRDGLPRVHYMRFSTNSLRRVAFPRHNYSKQCERAVISSILETIARD